jgi:hypothetical protein
MTKIKRAKLLVEAYELTIKEAKIIDEMLEGLRCNKVLTIDSLSDLTIHVLHGEAVHDLSELLY